MRQRGRHRRKRTGRALRAALAGTALALTGAAALITTSQAAGSDSPGFLTARTSAADIAELRLREDPVPESSLDRLSAEMGAPVGVDAVLADANHTLRGGTDCTADETGALPAAPSAARAYCWETGDATDPRWLPRSVTTSGDADEDGMWGANRVVLAGWTHDERPDTPEADRGLARVAFVDAGDPGRLRYRWVLLVVPVDGGSDYRKLTSRLDGMVWYQDKLLVTASDGDGGRTALYVYDMDRILRADVLGDAVGRTDEGWSAHRYRYVMPAVASYRLTGGACDPAADGGTPCTGPISLDRTSTPHSLVAAERVPADSTRHARLWRYDLSDAPDRTGLLRLDADGYADATEVYETGATGVRGLLSYRPGGAEKADWYLGQAPDDGAGHGTVWRQDGSGAKAATCGEDEAHDCWGAATGSMSYWQETGEVWSLTGVRDPGTGPPAGSGAARVLFSVPLADLDGTLE